MTVSVQNVSSAGELLTKRPTTTRDLIERFQAVGQETEQGKALYALATRMVDIFKDEKSRRTQMKRRICQRSYPALTMWVFWRR
ncbi:hypothetical protein N7488_006279 [Penicillium malachiteum]|nr:hypothetical protein N7488_006279 [Penicillium malachiteum]